VDLQLEKEKEKLLALLDKVSCVIFAIIGRPNTAIKYRCRKLKLCRMCQSAMRSSYTRE